MDLTASLDVTTRASDHCPEWMKKAIEEKSRSISKGAEQSTPPESLDDTDGNNSLEPLH
jgi:hypothetical protein